MVIILTVFFGVALAVYIGTILHRNGYKWLAACCYFMAAVFVFYMMQFV